MVTVDPLTFIPDSDIVVPPKLMSFELLRVTGSEKTTFTDPLVGIVELATGNIELTVGGAGAATIP